MTHSGEYSIPIYGTFVEIPVRVEYSWSPRYPATRTDPAGGGAELESISLQLGDELIEIADWPEWLVDEIHQNIAREHVKDAAA
jgi:hypothetical protein